MSARSEALEAAEDVADRAIESVIDAIRDAIQDRRDNALWFYYFHSEMLRRLPKWRTIARYHHRRMRDRAAAGVRANRCLVSVCREVV